MMPTPIGIMILIMSAIAAILAGIAVFTNVRPEKPDDPRIEPIREGVDDIRIKLDETLKTMMLMDAKFEKEFKDVRAEARDMYEKTIGSIDRLFPDSSE
jgi:hypothetical protein